MPEGLVQAFLHGFAAVLASRSFLQGGQAQIKRTPVFSALAERTAGIEVAAADQWIFCDHLTDAFHHRFSALKAGAFRQGEITPHLTLIFIRDEGCGNRCQSDTRQHQARQDQAQNDASSREPESQGFAIPALQAMHPMAKHLADAFYRRG